MQPVCLAIYGICGGKYRPIAESGVQKGREKQRTTSSFRLYPLIWSHCIINVKEVIVQFSSQDSTYSKCWSLHDCFEL